MPFTIAARDHLGILRIFGANHTARYNHGMSCNKEISNKKYSEVIPCLTDRPLEQDRVLQHEIVNILDLQHLIDMAPYMTIFLAL
jgi:hypothetical protein